MPPIQTQFPATFLSRINSPSFVPTDIDGLQWLLETATDNSLYEDSSLATPANTDEDVVGGVRDGSGNNRNATQTTAGNKAILLTESLNGHSVIRFDGTNDYLEVPATALSAATGTATLFFRVLLHPQAVTGILASGNKIGSNPGDWQITLNPNGQVIFFYDNVTNLTVSSAFPLGKWFTLVVRLDATGAQVYVDGALKGSNAVPGVIGGNDQAIRIGYNTNNASPLKFLMAAAGIYNVAITDTELAQLTTYFADIYPALSFTFVSRSSANVHAAQGVATDGTTFWTSAGTGSNNMLYKWSKSGNTYTELASRNVSSDWPTGATQINSLHYADGVIYAGCNNYATSPKEGYVLEYDADTLALIDTHTTRTNWSEGGAFDPGGNFFVCFDDTLAIEEYDNTWTLVGTHTADDTTATHQYSGIAWRGNIAFIPWHEPTISISVFKWTGTNLYFIGRVDPPTEKCTQGVHADPNDANKYWFAERTFAANDHRVIEARLANI